jgi:hypothetical protein
MNSTHSPLVLPFRSCAQSLYGARDCHPRRRLRTHAETRCDIRVRQPLLHPQDDQAAVAIAQVRELISVEPHM